MKRRNCWTTLQSCIRRKSAKEEDTKEKEREKEKADEDRELGAKLIQDATNGLKDKVVNKGMVSLNRHV